jgi:hypothetical protein
MMIGKCLTSKYCNTCCESLGAPVTVALALPLLTLVASISTHSLPRWKVYFKQDDRFGKPKAYLIFQVLTKEVFASPTNAALANLFELCASDRLTEYAYDGKSERRGS